MWIFIKRKTKLLIRNCCLKQQKIHFSHLPAVYIFCGKKLHPCPPALLLILFSLLKETTCYSSRQLKLYEFQEKLQEKTFSGIATSAIPFPSQALFVSRKVSNVKFFFFPVINQLQFFGLCIHDSN